MAVEVVTGRGVYHLSAAVPLESTKDSVILTLAMDRADGIERVVTKCRIERALLDEPRTAEGIIAQLREWLVRDFESIREAALKTIRTERRLNEMTFDRANRGPF